MNWKGASNIQSFYKLPAEERLKAVKDFASLTDDEVKILRAGSLSFDSAERMIENVVGFFPVPLGIAVNFLINNRDYLIPMAIEEPSVVAAASNAAKMARQTGGFKATSTESVMVGQIQLVRCPSPREAEMKSPQFLELPVVAYEELRHGIIDREAAEG